MKKLLCAITMAAVLLGATTAYAVTNEMSDGYAAETAAAAAVDQTALLEYNELDEDTCEVYCRFENREDLTSVVIPKQSSDGKKVTAISGRGFYDCVNLTSVTIPEGVTKIGDEAFNNCTSLTSITIPKSVTNIGANRIHTPFAGCTKLKEINVTTGNTEYYSEGGVVFSNGSGDKSLVIYPVGKAKESYAVPEGTKAIMPYAFQGNQSLKAVFLPESLTNIGVYAFSGCDSLTDVYYAKTNGDWGGVTVDGNNEPLLGAGFHYSADGLPDDDEDDDSKKIAVKIPLPKDGAPKCELKVTVTDSSDDPIYTVTYEDGILDLTKLTDDEYKFVFTADNCAPRTYNVTVKGGVISGFEDGVELHLYGDVDGDGEITILDVAKVNRAAQQLTTLTGYDKDVSDVDKNGKIETVDAAKINAHFKDVLPLWS